MGVMKLLSVKWPRPSINIMKPYFFYRLKSCSYKRGKIGNSEIDCYNETVYQYQNLAGKKPSLNIKWRFSYNLLLHVMVFNIFLILVCLNLYYWDTNYVNLNKILLISTKSTEWSLFWEMYPTEYSKTKLTSSTAVTTQSGYQTNSFKWMEYTWTSTFLLIDGHRLVGFYVCANFRRRKSCKN